MAIETDPTKFIDELLLGPEEVRNLPPEEKHQALPLNRRLLGWVTTNLERLIKRSELNDQEPAVDPVIPEDDLLKIQEAYNLYNALVDEFGKDLRPWGAKPERITPNAEWGLAKGNPITRAVLSRSLDSEKRLGFFMENYQSPLKMRGVGVILHPFQYPEVTRSRAYNPLILPQYSPARDLDAIIGFAPHLRRSFEGRV